MKLERIINQARSYMIKGRRMNPAQISQYENAIRQSVHDGLLEAVLLYMAEVLHDELGFGRVRTARILRKVDEHMLEWQDPEFQMDELRLRVFGKTQFMFACNEEDQKHIARLLQAAGYDVRLEGE